MGHSHRKANHPPLPTNTPRKRVDLIGRVGLFIGKLGVLGLFSIVALGLVWFGYIRYGPNFAQVKDQIYRSSQPYPDTLPSLSARYRFKTIVNLRGAHPEAEWYRFEEEFARRHHILLLNFPLPDREVVPAEKLLEIVTAIEAAPKPVLIHCKAGADRTGLVTAALLAWEGNRSAPEMLSLRYGHFRYFGSKTAAMDRSFQLFLHFLATHRNRKGEVERDSNRSLGIIGADITRREVPDRR